LYSSELPHKLKYRVVPEKLSVCQLPAGSSPPEWAFGPGFFCVTQTAEELSIVCEESRVPPGVRVERGWVALKLQGPFPFAMTGVLTAFLQPLADANIPIFAISTFDTDYVLMKRDKLDAAITALSGSGHEMVQPDDSAI
jgi:hypothetical protein